MNTIALYNNDQWLWNNYHASEMEKPNGGAILTVHDGHIGKAVLLMAGYVEIEQHKFKARA